MDNKHLFTNDDSTILLSLLRLAMCKAKPLGHFQFLLEQTLSNHPPEGSVIKVEPIRSKEKIGQIKTLLSDNPRDYALFVLGINTNLRASDLLRFAVGNFSDLVPGDSFEIKEKKTDKHRRITLNNGTFSALNALLKIRRNSDPEEPLFLSQRGEKALTVSSVNRLVKSWCRSAGLRGNFGSHTLRKTWGYHAYKTGIDLPRLMVMFNHSSQKQTLDYLCIQDAAIQEVYLKVEL